jgi:TolB-like protein/class 3 adenylate cyclase
MPLAREQRKLAAIVAADVVGYSRLMGRDESGTVARLRKNRSEHLDPVLAKYGGRLVKLTGDGALVEFASAVDALSAAIEFQQAMAEANRDQPADAALMFRMGLHLGDLIVDGDDLYGDGVNIAARLEAEAPTGGIVISRTVHEAVAGRAKATFDDLGNLALKNIERPVQAFSVKWKPSDWQLPVTSEVAAAAATGPQAPPPLPDKPSIAVLPFENISGDPEQEYFVDGLVEDIITALSRFKSLFVIARNSSFSYKGKSPDIRQVGRELGVRYVLEGSVRKASNRLRITSQLVDATNGAHLWADRFDGALEDVFDLQDRITASVVGIIAPTVERAEIERVRGRSAGNLQAYELVLRADALMRSRSRADYDEALRDLRKAIEMYPNYARGFSRLANLCFAYVAQGYLHRDHPLIADMVPLAQKALALDPTDADAMAVSGWTIAIAGGDMPSGLELVEKAMSLNPNYAEAYRLGGMLYGYLGEMDQALDCMQRADRLNPNPGSGRVPNHGYFIAYFGAGDHEAVLKWTARSLRDYPHDGPTLRYRAASLALLGRIEEARQAIDRFLEQRPGYTLDDCRQHQEFDMNSPFKKPGVTDALYRGLRLAGLPE